MDTIPGEDSAAVLIQETLNAQQVEIDTLKAENKKLKVYIKHYLRQQQGFEILVNSLKEGD